MRRAVVTHIGTRDQWLSRLNTRSDVSTDIFRGLDAYAHRQADVYHSLAVSFVDIWSPELRKNKLNVDWPPELADHAATVGALPERKSGRKRAKPAQMSDSGSEEGNDSDGESVLLHFAAYTDSENSEEEEEEGEGEEERSRTELDTQSDL